MDTKALNESLRVDLELLVLLSGDPGIGKSTILLQICVISLRNFILLQFMPLFYS